MKKRFILTSLAFILTASTLFGCSCMSNEQNKIAKENESVSKTIAEEYLKSNYENGTVNSLSCITYTPKESALGSRKASNYVRASATVNDKNFYILVNTDSKQCLDNYNSDDVKEMIKQRAAAALPNSTPADITAEIFANIVPDDINGNDYEGYLSITDKTADDILTSGNYSVNVTCSYIDDTADFSAIDTSSFLPQNAKFGSVTLTYLNYKDEARFRSGGNASYTLNDSFTSSFDGSSGQPQNEYKAYTSISVDDVEIAWDSTKLDLTVGKADDTPEPEIKNEDYPNLVFKPKSDNAIEINYKLLDKAEGVGDIDFYFDGTLYGSYGILNDSQNILNPNTVMEINETRSGVNFVPFTFAHDEGSFTLAIYTGEESNTLSELVSGFQK
ncbi:MULTISPECIES: hypothetical protein [unclassified Ruminococcus]|uniref:hypothetical protein n=1 Tax=unclassified Ruminococcus TaxID=2608920 RepID=UPI00210AAF2A|nr:MULTISPECIES: hypothetical protein [unclassified Ruminococcus]MCQ4022785.1 hypothetical protein [Ruminococcus sp. zg-924]MCQ4115761.1 hypothetical protein [Ruminococcus sp. zg-921]